MSKIHKNAKNQNNKKGQKNKENLKQATKRVKQVRKISMATKWQPFGNPGQDRIGKYSLVQCSLVKNAPWNPSGTQMEPKWNPRLGQDRLGKYRLG